MKAVPQRGLATVEDVHPHLRTWATVDEAALHLYEGLTVRVRHTVENGDLAAALISVDDYTPPLLSRVDFVRTPTGWRVNGSSTPEGQTWSPETTSYSRRVTPEVSVIVVRLGSRRKELKAEDGWVLTADRPVNPRDPIRYEILGYVTVDGQSYVGEPTVPRNDNDDSKSPDYALLTALSDAHRWVWAALRQIERFVIALHEDSPRLPGLPPTPQQQRLRWLVYSDAELLLNAANHVLTALSRVSDGPRLSDDLARKILHLRNIHEHWDEQRAAFAHRDLPKVRSGKKFAELFPEDVPWRYGFGADGHTISVLRLEDLWTELDGIDQELSTLSNAALADAGTPHIPEATSAARPFPYVDPGPRAGTVVAMATLAQSLIIGDLPSDFTAEH